jgi:hypothetical protein
MVTVLSTGAIAVFGAPAAVPGGAKALLGGSVASGRNCGACEIGRGFAGALAR